MADGPGVPVVAIRGHANAVCGFAPCAAAADYAIRAAFDPACGVVACGACYSIHHGRIHNAMRNSDDRWRAINSGALAFDGEPPTIVRRSNGAIEPGWELAAGTEHTRAVLLDRDGRVLVAMTKPMATLDGKPGQLAKLCYIGPLKALNPAWKPRLNLDADQWLGAAARTAWAMAWEQSADDA
jgi:hypothetical protein